MTCTNIDLKCGAPRGFCGRGRDAEIPRMSCVMPTHVFLRLFLSALAAILAIHFWKHGGR
jgi:hypothetical protein